MPAQPPGPSFVAGRTRTKRLRSLLFRGSSADAKVRVVLTGGLRGPSLPLQILVTDQVFVLKCKVEVALRLLRETQGEDVVSDATAEEIDLEYRGVPLRDMMAINRYGIEVRRRARPRAARPVAHP